MAEINELQGLLADRSLVVAGGTGNVGRVLVEGLIRRGATVIVPSRSRAKLDQLRNDLTEIGSERLVTLEGNIADRTEGPELVARIKAEHGPMDGAIATLGRFVPAPSLLEASVEALQQVIDGYLIAHFAAARALIPAIREGGSYTLINGPLAFQPMFAPAALVSTVTAAQAMLGRILMEQVESVRIHELVLYTPFGWGDDPDKRPLVTQEDVARFACYLASERAAALGGGTIHLDSPERLTDLIEGKSPADGRSSGRPLASTGRQARR